MKNLQLLTLFSVLFFFGCSSNGEEELPKDDFAGSFKVSVTGDYTFDLEGEAVFLHGILSSKGDDENGTTLGITLTDDTNSDNFIVLSLIEPGNVTGLGTGTYAITFDEEEGETFVSVAAYIEGNLTAFLATTGEIKLTKIDDNKVEGTLSVTLTNFNEETIKISGNYQADGVTKKL